MPVLVEREGALAYVLGTSGGRGHAQILAHVLLRLLAGAGPQDAVAKPRWAVGGLLLGDPDDELTIERGAPDDAVRALARAGLRARWVEPGAEFMGHAQVIAAGPRGSLAAGSDPRGGSGAAEVSSAGARPRA